MSDGLPQTESVGALLQRLAKDPLQLRVVVCVLSLGLAWLAVLSPLGARIAEARATRDKALDLSRRAEAALTLVAQVAAYTPLVVSSDDPVDWQGYFYEKLRLAAVSATTFEGRATDNQRIFHVVEFELTAELADYSQAWDLVDRLEHGNRPVRISRLQLVAGDGVIQLSCTLHGLAKPADGVGFRILEGSDA